MAFSLMNGLSSAGQGIATYAATAGLEAQKADLARQTTILADQLATTRESAGRQEAGQIAAAAAEKQNTFTSDQNAQNRATQLNMATIGANATTGAASIHAKSAAAVAAITSSAKPAEVKEAEWYANATPEQRQAYSATLMARAGLPPWMADQSGGAAAVASGAKPAATPPVTGAPTGVSDGGAAAGVAAGLAPEATPPVTGAPTGVSDGVSTPAPSVSPPVTGTDTSTILPSSPNRNDKALTGLPDAAVSMIKMMVDGKMSPPSGMAMTKPYWQAFIAKASEYDPNFDETSWASRVATRKDFTVGKSADAVTAINTALSHAGTLVGDFDKLNNFRFTPANVVLNEITPLFGDARQGKARLTVDALASEARKVFAASGGGNLTELKNWQNDFPINGSPSQHQIALAGFVDLLDGRLQTLADRYNRGMGTTAEPLNLLQPKARAVYEKLTGLVPRNSTGYQTGGVQDNPANVSPPASPAKTVAPVAPANGRPSLSSFFQQ